tara:strand:- start:35 stop:154 length:120 start_codon:yes stop_codon:yes gene_type:complete
MEMIKLVAVVVEEEIIVKVVVVVELVLSSLECLLYRHIT